MKLIKFFLLPIFTLVIATNLVFSQNTSDDATTQEPTVQVDTAKTIDVKVKGVGCATDIKTISSNVEKLDGVASCVVTKKGATTTFEVTMNASLVSNKEIYAAIENTAGCQDPDDRPYKVKL